MFLRSELFASYCSIIPGVLDLANESHAKCMQALAERGREDEILRILFSECVMKADSFNIFLKSRLCRGASWSK